MSSRFVSARGKSIVDPAGNELLLKGIGLGNWLLPEGYMFGFSRANSPRMINEVFSQLVGEEQVRSFWQSFREVYVDESDIRFLQSCGFNHVRIPFHYELFVTQSSPRKLEGPGYEILDRTVALCRDHGLYIILDMHGAPGGQTGDNIDDSWGFPFLYYDDASQQLTIDIWEELAARYVNEPVIAGYELLNEPIATHFDRGTLNPKLNDLYLRLIRSIRSVDENHLIILGGSAWNTDFSLFQEPPEGNIAYAFHRYWQPVQQEMLHEYLEFQNKWNVPLYMSESGENENEWVRAFRMLLEENNIGWAFWPYKKVLSPRGPLTIETPPGWDRIIKFAEASRSTYEEIRTEHPGRELSSAALLGFIDNTKFECCEVQRGFIDALFEN